MGTVPLCPPSLTPVRKRVPFQEWTPSIHYAQFQRVAPRLFPRRRLYDFELLYVCHCDEGANLHGVTWAAYRSAFRRLPPEGKEADPTTKLIGITVNCSR